MIIVERIISCLAFFIATKVTERMNQMISISRNKVGKEAKLYYDTNKSGRRISELRKSKGLSQAKLAEKLGIHVKTISKAERGICGLSIDYLILVAEQFNVSLEYLVGEEEREEIIVTELFNKCSKERKALLINVMKAFAEKGA